MNTHHTTYLAALMALVLLPACSRMETAPETGIRFAAPLQTKATDAVPNTDVFQVRDWYNGSSYYIDNTIRWNSGDSKWVYGTTPNSYNGWAATTFSSAGSKATTVTLPRLSSVLVSAPAAIR